MNWASGAEILSLVSAIAAGVATAAAAWSAFLRRTDATRALRNLRARQLETIIRTDDLRVIGDYLYNVLGDVPLSRYATDPSTRHEVLRLIEQADEFTDLTNPQDPTSLDDEAALDFERARADIYEGEVWNGLARLRRRIEIELRNYLEQAGGLPDVRASRKVPMSAHEMLRALQRTEAAPAAVISELRDVLSVANRAIHGYPIDRADAIEAFLRADRALAALSQPVN